MLLNSPTTSMLRQANISPCHESLERAASFVYTIAHAAATPIAHQLEALFGLSVAEKAGVPRAVAYVEMMAAQVCHQLDRECAGGGFDPFGFDATLLLLCHSAMRERDLESDTLAAFARDVSAGMREMKVIPRRLAGAARLLEAIGEEPFGETGVIEVDAYATETSLMRAETAEVREVCNRLAGASLFGTRRLVIAGMPDLLRSMPILLLQKLREYDLILGASLLRTLKYLGATVQEEAAYATQYLMCQQQADGRFGYYARELVEGPRLRNAEQELYLPVTVSVLWALAETSIPGFCMVSAG